MTDGRPTSPSVHIVSHTHWDREWYEPFEVFRLKLVTLIDGLLDILETEPDYAHFLLDGQTVLIQDYLALRPANRRRLERLVRAGRLAVGPWYVLPDEFLVGGESLIRNLGRGIAEAQSLGGAMSVGYVPDTFGHSVDLPTILNGFGLDTACLWRGVGDPIRSQAFRWQAPSGAEVLVAYLATSYSNAVALPGDPATLIDRVEQALEELRPVAQVPVFLLMNGSDHQFPRREVGPAIGRAEAEWGKGRLTHSTLPGYLEELRSALGGAGGRGGQVDLPVVSTELRDGRRAPILTGTLSSRIRQKQRNHALESLLTGAVEPAAALARLMAGARYPYPELDHAWGLLLQNHPHDSICGCSIDIVHREVETRFDRVEQVARWLLDGSLEALAESAGREPGRLLVFNPAPEPGAGLVEAVVPDGDFDLVDRHGDRTPLQPVTAGGGDVVFDLSLSPLQLRGLLPFVAGREVQGRFVNQARLSRPSAETVLIELVIGPRPEGEVDVAGVKAQVVSLLGERGVSRFRVVARRSPERRILLRAVGVPGLGVLAYQLVPPGGATADRGGAVVGGGFARAVGARALENDHLVLTVNRDGTLDATSRDDGRTYRRLHQLVDEGDRGDLYNYCPPEHDTPIDRPVRPVRVRVVENGPLRATLEIMARYRLPRGLRPDRKGRLAGRKGTVEVAVTVRVSLVAGDRLIHFHTSFDNRAADHRWRAIFPAPVPFTRHWGLSHFSVVERGLDAPPDRVGEWAELPSGTWPNAGFFGCDGLAVFTRGLPEYGVVTERSAGDVTGVALALTLVRSVGWLSRDDLWTRPAGHAGPALATPEGQSPGPHELEYALCLAAGDWRTAGLTRLYEGYRRGLLALPGATAPDGGDKAPDREPSTLAGPGFSGLECVVREGPGPVVASAVRLVRDAGGERLVVRLVNLGDQAAVVVVTAPPELGPYTVLDLAERPVEAPRAPSTPVRFGPWQVVTLGFDLGDR